MKSYNCIANSWTNSFYHVNYGGPQEEAISVKSQKCPHHVTFDLNLDFEHMVNASPSGDHHDKLGHDPAICVEV